MYTTSAAFDAAIRSGDQVAVITARAVLSGVTVEELKFEGGSVGCDGRREGALRTLSLDVIPSSDTWANLNTPGVEIVVERGLVINGTEELVPLGVFVIDADLEQTDDGNIPVSAADRSRRISRARWTEPYAIAAGTDVGTAIAALLADRWSSVECTFGAIGVITGAQVVMQPGGDSDPWKDARAIADAAGYDLYFDNNGRAALRIISDPETASADETYYDGELSIVVSKTRRSTISTVYNGVIATGEGTGIEADDTGAVPVTPRGEAWDTDPFSPTYSDGPFGRVPYFYSSPLLTTDTAAQAAAETRLAKVKGRAEQIAWTLIVNPAHEAFDVVDFVEDGITHRFMLDQVTIPLAAKDAMPAAARETRVA